VARYEPREYKNFNTPHRFADDSAESPTGSLLYKRSRETHLFYFNIIYGKSQKHNP
jgi:hypothetical protein